MNIIAVIPARMQSKRIPRKNLCELEPGLTLVQHAVDCAGFSGMVNEVIVSSDEAIPCAGARLVRRPPHLSTDDADIAQAVAHAVEGLGADYVVTLQPAVVARSPLIVRTLVQAVVDHQCGGGLTMATTHRWIWHLGVSYAQNDWHPGPYPRSQDSFPRTVEVNAVQVASAAAVASGARWGLPLAILELPSWTAALDIDTQSDLDMARDLWPWARSRLETCQGHLRLIREITPCG